jgi:hypothetical protein
LCERNVGLRIEGELRVSNLARIQSVAADKETAEITKLRIRLGVAMTMNFAGYDMRCMFRKWVATDSYKSIAQIQRLSEFASLLEH